MGKRKRQIIVILVLTILFGTGIVYGQELLYKNSLEAAKDVSESISSEDESSESIDEKEPSASEAAESMESSEQEESASSQEPKEEKPEPSSKPEKESPKEDIEVVQTGAPIGYKYSENSTEVLISYGGLETTVNFAGWHSESKDFKAVLIIPETGIDYPVVQGEDNAYYLRHSIDGKYDDLGTLFMDSRNKFMEDENVVIYGHNYYTDGDMFAKLMNYLDQDYYEAHKKAYLLTMGGGYILEIASVYKTDIYDRTFNIGFTDEAEYSDYLNYIKESSAVATGINLSNSDKLISLTTCTNTDQDSRLVVVCKLSAFQ